MIFETTRLIARRFDPRDLETFVAMRNDPQVFRYQSWNGYTEDEGRSLLRDLARMNPGDPGWFQFALEDRETGAFVGDCGIDISEKDNRLAEIGYTFRPLYWGRGLCTEAVIALTHYAFKSFGLHRIYASVDPRNIPSCRVMQKAGYMKEAHFRQSLWDKGEWTDDVIFARLSTDI